MLDFANLLYSTCPGPSRLLYPKHESMIPMKVRSFFSSMVWSIVILTGSMFFSSPSMAASQGTISITGTLVAVNISDTPNAIVLKALNKDKEELIVGATVHPEVDILRGTQKVSLKSLKVGETIQLVYSKTLEGLVAHTIHVR